MKKLLITAFTMLMCIAGFAQHTGNQASLDLPEVYRDENVVFWKLDKNTWIGSGNRVSSETLYLIEGEKKAVLIDAGTRIPDLDKIVARITKKPVSLLLTHGHGDHVGIRYSTNWIERCFAGNDTLRLDYETRGVLYHELTHAYQLSPEGCGQYDGKSEYWIFIEGMADAVRVACGCFDQDFSSKDRPRANTWRKGYRVTGYFLYWLMLNKDKDFLRKFNRTAVEIKPWSWDKAMKHILGDKPENTTEALWQEYLKAIGD